MLCEGLEILTGWEELGISRSIVGLALAGLSTRDTSVTRAGQEGNTTGTKLHELVADAVGVVAGNSLLVVTVGRGDGLGDGALSQDVVEPVEVGLVGVAWGTLVRFEGRLSTGLPVDVLDGVGQAHGISISCKYCASL